ncbi:MAG: hypothetical protein ACO3N3_05075, partial [bacterium]
GIESASFSAKRDFPLLTPPVTRIRKCVTLIWRIRKTGRREVGTIGRIGDQPDLVILQID